VAAPQNLYQTAGPDEYGRDDCWVAVAVASDEQWTALRGALGDPAWAADPELATAVGRARAHDRIDEHLQEWCRDRTVDDVVKLLSDAGVPVGHVVQPHRQPDLEQLAHRGFFEEVDHPVIGTSRCSTLPMRLSRSPERFHTRHAPLLGEHTAALLAELGLSPGEIDSLAAAGIVGDTLAQQA
jgi:crotonobetainyl-CoA:carnitine CoA-transferase CaiB-like acyl-CoA transferase